MNRTSAPARQTPGTVRADDPLLLAEPFALWGGEGDVPPLTEREVSGLRRFVALGGVLLVDDFAPEEGSFSRAARRELRRVVPEGSPIPIGPENVVFKSFYLIRRAVGRVEGPAQARGRHPRGRAAESSTPRTTSWARSPAAPRGRTPSR